jgi:RNA polymerase sigma-70 factor (ECF subfamily)
MLKKVAEKVKELNPSYADIIAVRYYYQYEDVEISQILEI